MRTAHLIALLGLTTLFGCRDTTAPTGDSNAAPIDFMSQLTLSTTLSSSVLTTGTPITVTVTLRNVSKTTAHIEASGCPSRFVVDSRDGHAVAPGGEVCTLVGIERDLAPGESISFSQDWSGMSVVGGDGLVTVPAGEYIVLGSSRNGAVRSNPGVKLTIVP